MKRFLCTLIVLSLFNVLPKCCYSETSRMSISIIGQTYSTLIETLGAPLYDFGQIVIWDNSSLRIVVALTYSDNVLVATDYIAYDEDHHVVDGTIPDTDTLSNIRYEIENTDVEQLDRVYLGDNSRRTYLKISYDGYIVEWYSSKPNLCLGWDNRLFSCFELEYTSYLAYWWNSTFN